MPTEEDVRRSLKRLPDTLTTAYDEIYGRILAQKGSAPRMALNAFRWIQNSYEPLCSETLLDAVTVEVGSSGEYFHNATVKANELLRACQNLLILDKSLNVFRFAHLSVDEYLESKLLKIESHAEIAKACLSLLCTPSWGGYDTARETTEGAYGNRHLLLYSAVFWPWHFSRCEDVKGCQILTDLWDKFISETNCKRWLHHHSTKVKIDLSFDKFWRRARALQQTEDPTLLSVVCVFGLSRIFTTVFESTPHGPRREPKDSIDRLLGPACEFGDLDIAQLLIDRGADVSAARKDGWTPLHLASRGGHEAVAQLLFDRGADVSAADEDGETPLHFASSGGYEAVARLLIDRGADVSAARKDGWTPLHLASRGGREAVAQLLIDRGADVSAADKNGSTPLDIAASSIRGRGSIVAMLRDRATTGNELTAALSPSSSP
jgi:sirohydrochlorin ferrochelatase